MPELIDLVTHLCENPDTFLLFDLQDFPPKSKFHFSPMQEKHAALILKTVPALAKLRYEICPSKMSEDSFWYVYFQLTKKRLVRLGVFSEGLDVDDWVDV